MNINYYNPYVRQELELYHHGIAGQKWGKRNGPPYPIAASAHSASEKKAGWRKSLDGGGKDYSKRNARLAKKYDTKAAKAQGKMLDAYDKYQKYGDTAKGKREWEKSKKYRSKYFDNEKMSKRFADAGSQKISRFTSEQKAKAKKIAVTALKVAGGIAITAASVYAGYKGYKAAQYAIALSKMNKAASSLPKPVSLSSSMPWDEVQGPPISKMGKANSLPKPVSLSSYSNTPPREVKSVTYDNLGRMVTTYTDGSWEKVSNANPNAVRRMKRSYRLNH